MATSVLTSVPFWLTGCTYDGDAGNDLRNSGVTAAFYDEGIMTGSSIGVLGGVIGGGGLQVSPGTGMQVTVQPGSFVVPNSGTPTAGGYVATLASLATLTVATSDPTNPRIDIVVAYVSDVGTSSSFGAIEIITGTPAASPSAPSAPANSITLAEVEIPASATSVVSGDITDERPFTTATGGVLVTRSKGAVTGYVGQLAYDLVSGSFYHNDNLGVAQAHVLPFTPQTARKTTNVAGGGLTPVTVCSVTVTVDGSTDLEMFADWYGFAGTSGTSGDGITMYLEIDSTIVKSRFDVMNAYDTGPGGSMHHVTASGIDRPAAGTHTVSLMMLVNSSCSLVCTTTSGLVDTTPTTLYVRPAPL
jgi:hypothetical protein